MIGSVSKTVSAHLRDVSLCRYIHSKNRAGLSYSLSINHLADHTEEELAIMRGGKHRKTQNKAQPFPTELRSLSLPDSLDWRLYGMLCTSDSVIGGSPV